MTTIRIDIPDDRAAELHAKAAQQGLSLEAWFEQVAAQEAPGHSVAHLQRANPEEWARLFDQFVDSQPDGRPVLSDEAMSRESTYPDR